MKKILFFNLLTLVAIATASIGTSCSKDDEGAGKVEKDNVLYKTWYKYAGFDRGEDLYDEFIFNADGTFKQRILTMSFSYRTIDGTYRIVGRTADYVENDYIEAYQMSGYKVKTKFTIEFNPSEYDIETVEIMYLESRNDSSKKSIVVTTPLFDRSGGYYNDWKN